jgi:hypothetical protein
MRSQTRREAGHCAEPRRCLTLYTPANVKLVDITARINAQHTNG